MIKEISLQAPAKINLGLQVLRKREDGYHEIETIFQMVSLYDDLTIEASGRGITIETDHPELPVNEDNLIFRAAVLLGKAAGKVPALRIRLTKRIPLSAGLGGGSSDAAATLWGLNRLWGLDYPEEKLMDLSAEIGMDVPFFLYAPSAYAGGRGEILEKIPPPSPPLWVLLVDPGIKMPTKRAYRGLKLGLTIENKHISIRRFSFADLEDARFFLENDLEKVTMKEFPLLQEIKVSLKRWGASEALMSGSGPTIYGLFPDRQKAEYARQCFSERKDYSVFLVQTLNAFPFR